MLVPLLSARGRSRARAGRPGRQYVCNEGCERECQLLPCSVCGARGKGEEWAEQQEGDRERQLKREVSPRWWRSTGREEEVLLLVLNPKSQEGRGRGAVRKAL